MKAFIKKHEYNYIDKSLTDLNNYFKTCTDPNIIETTKAYIQDKILNYFTNLSEEEKEMLKTMIDAGTKVEIQIIAEDAAVDVSKLL